MTGHYALNPDHSTRLVPIRNDLDLIEWARQFDGKSRRVAFTQIAPGIRVSTVFLALDHSFGSGPPLLFETMSFTDYGETEQWRYPTWDDAAAGHESAVRRMRAKSTNRDSLKEPQDGR